MTDLIAVVETTARDPLTGAFALIAVGGLKIEMLEDGDAELQDLAVCGKTGKFELLPFRYGALCWWFSRLDRHKRLFLYGVRLCGNQFRDADQVVGDEVQQKILRLYEQPRDA